MKKPAEQGNPKAKAQLVDFPVFASNDPVGRVSAMAIAGRRDMQVSVRGERLIEYEVEVFRSLSHEEVARDLTLEQLVETFKVKMYNESIPDQTVYDLLFGDRLERQWARAYRAREQPFWKRILK